MQAAIIEMAWEQLQDGWGSLDVTEESVTTAATIDAVTDLFWDLLVAWGDVAATSAADFYDEHRARSGASGSFSAVLAESVSREQAAGSVRWVLNPGAQDDDLDLERMLGKLQGPLQRLVRQTGRRTVDQAVARDPARPRVARVPMGNETCAFCLVLASRGPVYRSLTTAGHDTRFHDFDDCEQVVVWTRDPDELPEGYDPGEMYGQYEEAVNAAGTRDLRRVLAKLREQQRIR